MTALATPPTTNPKLLAWVEEWAAVLQPDAVHWCDGSDAEYAELCQRLVASGTFTPLDPEQAAQQLLRPQRRG